MYQELLLETEYCIMLLLVHNHMKIISGMFCVLELNLYNYMGGPFHERYQIAISAMFSRAAAN